jgi:hypothetical protein
MRQDNAKERKGDMAVCPWTSHVSTPTSVPFKGFLREVDRGDLLIYEMWGASIIRT